MHKCTKNALGNDFEGHSRSPEMALVDRPLYHLLLMICSNNVYMLYRLSYYHLYTVRDCLDLDAFHLRRQQPITARVHFLIRVWTCYILWGIRFREVLNSSSDLQALLGHSSDLPGHSVIAIVVIHIMYYVVIHQSFVSILSAMKGSTQCTSTVICLLVGMWVTVELVTCLSVCVWQTTMRTKLKESVQAVQRIIQEQQAPSAAVQTTNWQRC